MQKDLKQMSTVLGKMVGKKVFVTLDGGWTGYVVGVVDENTLNVSKANTSRSSCQKLVTVNIFDVRST